MKQKMELDVALSVLLVAGFGAACVIYTVYHLISGC
jgi:hypothetical protein